MLAEPARFAVQGRIQMIPSNLASTASLLVFPARTTTSRKNEDHPTCELKFFIRENVLVTS